MTQLREYTVAAPRPSWAKRILAVILLVASAVLWWYTITTWLKLQ